MLEASSVEGGIVEQIGDASYPLVLLVGGIIRFEKKHRSIYDFSDGYFKAGQRGGVEEVMDIVALGLVGAGMSDKDADKVMADIPTQWLNRLELIAIGLIGAALFEYPAEDEGDKKKEQASEQQVSTVDS